MKIDLNEASGAQPCTKEPSAANVQKIWFSRRILPLKSDAEPIEDKKILDEVILWLTLWRR